MVDSILLAVVVIAIIGLAAVFYVARRDGWPDPVWWTRVTVSAGRQLLRVKDLFTRFELQRFVRAMKEKPRSGGAK